jgi:transcriptional regulator with XRE-family HTH domain
MKANNKIKELRKSRGWTQDELAEKVGYKSRSAIAAIESDRSDIPFSMLIKFAEVFGVPINSLTDSIVSIKEDTLSDDEQRLLMQYRRLNEYQKLIIRRAAGDPDAGEESNKKESGPHLGGSADRE